MSMITCVALVTNKSKEELLPAGTTAALPTTKPCSEVRIATSGLGRKPVGHALRYPNAAGGTTKMFSEYAFAAPGMPVQRVLAPGLIVRIWLAGKAGGPKGGGRSASRVSISRQGEIATSVRA